MGTSAIETLEKILFAVMATIKNNHYTIKNARRKRKPMKFVMVYQGN